MTDMLIVLLVLAAVSVYYYGMRAAIVLLICTAVCCAADFICLKLRKKEFDIHDLSSLITGLTLGLMMSASVPYYAAVVASLFAVVIAKHAFGGHGCEIFNAAAAGFLFTALCFPDNMLTYPQSFSDIPYSSIVSPDILSPSMTKSFILTDTSTLSVPDILAGKFVGPLGTNFIIILAVGAVFLMLRRSVSAIAFFAELVTALLFAFVHYEYDLLSVLYFFSSGMMLFGMIFLSCDHSTIPKTKSSRAVYGILMGACIVLFHFYARVENAVVYAAILTAPLGIELDRRALSFAEMMNKKSIFRRVNKPLKHMQETLEILDKNEQE